MKNKPITGEELMARLNADPAYRARQEAEDAEIARRVRERERAEGPIVEALALAGIQVRSVWDLVNVRTTPAAALPVLLAHLQKQYAPAIREGIARALAVRDSRFAWNTLAELFKKEQEPRVREALAIAVAESADNSVLDGVIELIQDRSNGDDRVHLLGALKRSKDSRAISAILSLANDPALEYEVNKYLRAKEKREHRDRRRDHN
jgi:aminopeptidase N